MSYLVDTNVFSEPLKSKPGANVVAWLRAHESDLCVSAITIGEIRRGIERLPSGRRKTQLRVWLVTICECMKGRVLSFNASTAHVWGQSKAKWDAAGVAVPSLDSQIAATALRHQLKLGDDVRWQAEVNGAGVGQGARLHGAQSWVTRIFERQLSVSQSHVTASIA